jgi:cyclic pyranopterin phosphate synthase
VHLPVVEPRVTPRHPHGRDAAPRSIAAVRVMRLSVTDRCNFRCAYCMPEAGVAWLPKDQLLSFEEIAEVARAAVDVHGIRRFKLTGGEPTLRRGLLDLVAMLRRVPGVTDLSLTTNGQRLGDLAGPLRAAGLDRVTVSLDSLRADRFRRITRTGDLAAVLAGMDRARDANFASIKINCVTMRGTNDDEIPDFARLSLASALTVRFIEYMPLGDAAMVGKDEGGRGNDEEAREPARLHPSAFTLHPSESGPAGGCGAQDRGAGALVPEAEARRRIEEELGPLVPIAREAEPGVGPANVYRLARGNPAGRIGFISAMSAPFCATCNRLRLTADGVLRSCLFEGGEVDVRRILRETPGPVERRAAVAAAMVECVRKKPAVHSGRGATPMSRIGG